MNLEGKGWLKKYIGERKKYSLETQGPLAVNQYPDESLYQVIQPTGLLYGHPIQVPYFQHELMSSINTDEKMNLIFLEGLFFPMMAVNSHNIQTPDDRLEVIRQSSEKALEYYEAIHPELLGARTTFLGKKKENINRLETLIRNRVNIRGGFTRNFWQQFFHNSLLFLDIFYFRKFVNNNSNLSLESISKENEEIRLSILKIIALAAMADGTIGKEEEKLFRIFLKSANLPGHLEKEAREFLHQRLNLDDFEIPKVEDSWLLKKYLLELAILTVWSDKVVTEEEDLFVKKLARKFNFDSNELDTSMMAIESFILEHWDRLHYFNLKSDYSLVSRQFITKLSLVVNKNKGRIIQEINESKELVALLNKSRTQELSAIEKEIVRQQILDILKLIPAVVIFVLPFTFITLPVLIKILPKSAFPSAFQE